jgi:hypothetical protein
VTTIAAGYATASTGESRTDAAVHGFAEASYWSAGILVVAAIVWWLMPGPTTAGALADERF